VTALSIVPHLDVLEDRLASLCSGRVDTRNTFGLQRIEELSLTVLS
jgi:hypothetical protein